MKNIWIVLAVCLPFPAAAESVSISGKVTDKSGKPVAGIWVGLEKTMIATLTANDGSWSLNGTTGVVSRSTRSIPVTRHLVHEGGRLRVSLDGMDAKGRNLSTQESTPSPSRSITSARSAADYFDTLLYVHRNSLLTATPTSSASFHAGTVALDTSRVFPYTRRGDTLEFMSDAYAVIDCSSTFLTVWSSTAEPLLNRIQMTPEGIQLVFNGLSPDETYQMVAKFQRLVGIPGSLIGRFQLVDQVYHPTIAIVPDSTKKIIAEDSASRAKVLAELALVYEFTETEFRLVGGNTSSFARQFLNEWSYADEGMSYSSFDSTWSDDRRYSDSARYDIAVQIVDSSTVRLTGAKTGEIVTIRGTPVANGFDRTYSSSNSAHATGTRLAVPTSCPEAADWYDSFRSANAFSSFTPFAARRYEPGPMPSKPRRILPFF